MPTAPTETDYVSWSRLQSFADCGEKYRLYYQEGAEREPQGAYIAGSAGHAVIEEFERQGLISRLQTDSAFDESNVRTWLEKEFVSAFSVGVEEAGGADKIRWSGRKTKEFPDGENVPWWTSQGPAMLRRFLDVRIEDSAKGLRMFDESIERKVTALLPSGAELVAYVDAALMMNSEPRIRDYKLGKPGGADPLQLAIYAWLFREALGVEVTKGEFVYLRQKDPLKRIVPFDVSRFLPIIPDLFQRHEQLLDAGVYLMRPSNFCVSCSVRKSCSYGSLLGAVAEAEG